MEAKEEKEKKSIKKTTEKKVDKKTTTKKSSTTAKKKETKKVENTNTKKKTTKKEIEKPIEKEIVKRKIDKKDELEINEIEPELENKEEIVKKDKIEKYGNTIIVSLLLAISIVFLIFLSNKSFFRNTYKNGDLVLKLPLFMYFVSDDGNTVKFKTLRKSEYIKQYFDEYLSNLENFDYYACNDGRQIYYNSDNKNAIYSIDVEKNFALKTITVKYDIVEENTLCK